jgi:hypothetical protein
LTGPIEPALANPGAFFRRGAETRIGEARGVRRDACVDARERASSRRLCAVAAARRGCDGTPTPGGAVIDAAQMPGGVVIDAEQTMGGVVIDAAQMKGGVVIDAAQMKGGVVIDASRSSRVSISAITSARSRRCWR